MMRFNDTNSNDGTANMVKILAKQRRGMKICHINAQSLRKKIDEFRYVFETSYIDIICISETWFDSNTTDSYVSLNGYNVFRNDRKGFAGGVVIYVKKELILTIFVDQTRMN